jgi:hypothetical protein
MIPPLKQRTVPEGLTASATKHIKWSDEFLISHVCDRFFALLSHVRDGFVVRLHTFVSALTCVVAMLLNSAAALLLLAATSRRHG